MGREFPQGRRVGNYAVERLLSKAGLWASYVARQTRTERPCVLTVFYLDPDDEPWTRFKRESEGLSALRHPSLAEVLDVGIAHDGTPYLVHELDEGEDLASRLRKSGALTLSEALSVARQAGAALYAGHGLGVLHRDVRPDNIFILASQRGSTENNDDQGPGFERIKLLGFGVGRLLEATLSGMAMVGNPDYLAPEQVLGHPLEVDARADQYALAVVLYQSLTTTRPFHGDSVGSTLVQVTRAQAEPLRALRPDVPPHIEAAITRAMSRDREARFDDLNAFLQTIQEGVPLPMGMAELTEPWLAPPADIDEARRLAQLAGAAPAAPLSIGVSAALARAARALTPVSAEGAGAAEVAPAADIAPALAAMTLAASFGPSSPAVAIVGPPVESSGAGEDAAKVRHPIDAPAEAPASEAAAVPQMLTDQPTVPHSMEAVMQLAVPKVAVPEAVPATAEFDSTVPAPATPPPSPVQPLLELSAPLEIIAEYTEDGRPVPRAGETEVPFQVVEKTQRKLPSIIVDLPTRPVGEGDHLPPGVAAPGDATRSSTTVQRARRALPDLWQRLADHLEARATVAERLGWAFVGAGLGGLLGYLLS